MGRIIDTQPFSREGKEGLKITLVQRAVSEGTARNLALPQALARFPTKSKNTTVLGVRQVDTIAGPVKKYEVDIFIPVKDLNGNQVESGDTRRGSQMT